MNIKSARGWDDVWIWDLLACLSAIGCAAGGWIRSYFAPDIKRRNTRFCRKKYNIRIKKKLKEIIWLQATKGLLEYF